MVWISVPRMLKIWSCLAWIFIWSSEQHFFFYLGIEFLLSLADVEVEWMQPLHWRQRPGAPISNDAIFPWLEGSHWLPSPVIYSWRACLGYCYLFTWIYWTTREMFLKSVKHILFWRLKNDEYCSISTRVSCVYSITTRSHFDVTSHAKRVIFLCIMIKNYSSRSWTACLSINYDIKRIDTITL